MRHSHQSEGETDAGIFGGQRSSTTKATQVKRNARWAPGLVELRTNQSRFSTSIYKFVCELFGEYHHRLLWTLENPDTSLFWLTSWAVQLKSLPNIFQICISAIVCGDSKLAGEFHLVFLELERRRSPQFLGLARRCPPQFV